MRTTSACCSVVVMLGSWIWQLKSWMTRQQKNAGDAYTSRVMQTMMDAQSAESPTALDALKTDLLATLTSAVSDLDADKLSEESFQSFRDVLQIVLQVIRERREILLSRRNFPRSEDTDQRTGIVTGPARQDSLK
jgi:hypothetical protein